jgi:hypothetical protein
VYADMHAGHCTADGPGCQMRSCLLAPAHLCTNKLPPRLSAMGHHRGATTAWANVVNIARYQPMPAHNFELSGPELAEGSVPARR